MPPALQHHGRGPLVAGIAGKHRHRGQVQALHVESTYTVRRLVHRPQIPAAAKMHGAISMDNNPSRGEHWAPSRLVHNESRHHCRDDDRYSAANDPRLPRYETHQRESAPLG